MRVFNATINIQVIPEGGMMQTFTVSHRFRPLVAMVFTTCAVAIAALALAASAYAGGSEYFCGRGIPAHEVCHGGFGTVAGIWAEDEKGVNVCVNVETFSGGSWHNATPWVCNNKFVSTELSPWVYGSPTILNNSNTYSQFSGLAVYE
jgi:hypothetical protein